jgi:nucleoside-diphosphate-sugar epimerase
VLSSPTPRVGDGQNLIDTIYVENAAEAHWLAADALTAGSPVCGKAYFISQDDPANCWQWIDQILDLAGMPRVHRSISLAGAWKIGRLMEAAYRVMRLRGEPPMTRFLAAQLGRSHWYDISRAKTDFGYSPRVSTGEGLERLASSWRAE